MLKNMFYISFVLIYSKKIEKTVGFRTRNIECRRTFVIQHSLFCGSLFNLSLNYFPYPLIFFDIPFT